MLRYYARIKKLLEKKGFISAFYYDSIIEYIISRLRYVF
ncbi:hypothetical protein J2T17_002439 [Paenibacillus mucilaginosus]